MEKITILILTIMMMVSCSTSKNEVREYPKENEFVMLDTISYGDDRFHDDHELGFQVFGYTKSGDTLRVKWIPRKRWQIHP